MPLSEAELKKREELLRQDQIAWSTEREALERKVIHDRATAEVLDRKVKAHQGRVAELNLNLDNLTEQRRLKQLEVDNLEEGRRVSERKAEAAKQTLSDLEVVIESKRQRIDGDMAAYAARRRKETDASLSDVQGRLQALTEQLGGVQQQLEMKRKDLEVVLQDLVAAREEAGQVELKHEVRIKELRAELGPLEVEEGRLRKVVSKLLALQKQVEADLAKAEQTHQNFIDYERRARKVLGAKDKELQEKATELAVTSHRVRASRSFLDGL